MKQRSDVTSVLSLVDETKIGCDLCFMVAFSRACFGARHVKWLQMIDERAGDFGCVSCHVPVRTHDETAL